jgi:hypothetical protein
VLPVAQYGLAEPLAVAKFALTAPLLSRGALMLDIWVRLIATGGRVMPLDQQDSRQGLHTTGGAVALDNPTPVVRGATTITTK